MKNRLLITSQSRHEEQPDIESCNNLDTQYHNFGKQKECLISQFSMNNSGRQITTSNNEKETETYKKTIIDIKNFFPKNYEEQKCQEIAGLLGEKDMTFILSCLSKYGLAVVERAWGLFREKEGESINNPAAYFNKLISKLNG
ncbi:hypothetical protein KJ782_04065 [Patescibacteria group bacterium]|nr:hypothetical protein [Patescibacteria group bacterium]